MPTLDNLVDQTLGMFTAFTGATDQVCYLLTDMTADDLSTRLSDPGHVGRGLYEIDNELIYAASGDTTNGALTIAPFGRGQQSSVPAAHTAGTKVTRAPRVPRARAIQMLNQAIAGLYPDLFVVKSDESQTAKLLRWGYPLPAEAEEVLDVKYRTPPFSNWVGVRQWRIDNASDTADYPPGRSISIGSPMWPGAPIKITYVARPKPLVSGSDDWAATTGLPDSASDLAVLWAAERLVSADELLRTQTRTVEQSQRGTVSPAGAAANASRLMHQQYTERLAVEKRALQAKYGLPRLIRSWT